MDIIIVSLPKYFDPICILFQKTGNNVYYLKLSHSINITKEVEDNRVKKLLTRGIAPLPLADLPRYRGISEIEIDPEMKAYERTREIAPAVLLNGLKSLFPNIPHIEKKLELAVHSTVNLQQMYVVGKTNIWARTNPKKKVLLIDFDLKSLVNPRLEPNIWQIIIPLSIFEKGFRNLISLFHSTIQDLLWKLIGKSSFNQISRVHVTSEQKNGPKPRVAYVTHQGLKFGSLFQKDLFYAANKESELSSERILHIDYSGVQNPSEKLQWVCLGSQRQSYFMHLFNAFIALGTGIFYVRRIRHIYGLFILIRFYVGFCSYKKKVDAYPDLRIALIDYDVLCPKDLILAFETKGIKTIATQERFVSAFVKLFTSVILNDYLCNSPCTADAMKKNPLNCVDHYIPVGQYRSDNLLHAQKMPPPKILEKPIAKGYKIITALGYHTHLKWQDSQVDLVQNWKTHKQFLEDMIRLSQDLAGIFLILRYKNVDWIALPEFADVVQKINSSENILISTDYHKDFVSYEICAHSDLIIAKYTSLADECLSIGIPVLFYEYTHNTERILSDVFNYHPAKIMCYNYQELKERTSVIISHKPNQMSGDYDTLKMTVYGGLSDGKVKERIHKYIEGQLVVMLKK